MSMIVIYYHILCNVYSKFDHDHRVCVYMRTNLLSLSRKLNENFVLILSSIVVNIAVMMTHAHVILIEALLILHFVTCAYSA